MQAERAASDSPGAWAWVCLTGRTETMLLARAQRMEWNPRMSAEIQTTLTILKPDAVQRSLMGRIMSRFEDKGLQIVGCKMMQISRELAERHYEVHRGKPFYERLVQFMTSSPVLVMAVRGVGAVEVCRKLMGATFGSQAVPGTIRGDFGVSNSFNLIHGSDSPETAQFELALFFDGGELLEIDRAIGGRLSRGLGACLHDRQDRGNPPRPSQALGSEPADDRR